MVASTHALLAALLLSSASASAQASAEVREPTPASGTASLPLDLHRIPLHTAPADSVGGDYGVWAAGRGYKASFDGAVAFYPALGEAYPHNLPLEWRTISASSGPLVSPRLDTTVRGVQPLDEHDLASLPAIGAKASQLAELARVDISVDYCTAPIRPRVPEAPFAIPLVHYLEHFEESGARGLLDELRADAAWVAEPETRAAVGHDADRGEPGKFGPAQRRPYGGGSARRADARGRADRNEPVARKDERRGVVRRALWQYATRGRRSEHVHAYARRSVGPRPFRREPGAV